MIGLKVSNNQEGVNVDTMVEEVAIKYAFIAGVKMEYTFKHPDEVSYDEHPYVVKYLGIGVDSINPDEELMHYYLETNEINIKKEEKKTMNKNTEVKQIIVDENTPINDDTIEDVLMSSPDSEDRLNVLINYSKVSLGSLLDKDPADVEKESVKIHTKLASILNMLLENKMLDDDGKKKFQAAMDEEIAEYEKIMNAFEKITEETVAEAKASTASSSSSSSNSDWVMWLLGGLLVAGAGYAIYRYLNPEDVIIDMSTMNILNR